MEVSDSESIEYLQDTAREYEKIFEEIQNFEISDHALDKIEGVLDENISLKQENLQMMKKIEEMQGSIEAQNFRSVFESLKTRQNSENLEICINNRPSIPPPPPLISENFNKSKPKYRLLFWEKLDSTPNSIFDNLSNIKIRQASINKFPFSSAKPPLTINSDTKQKALEYNREIVINSALRSFGLNPEQILLKLQNFSEDFFNDPDRVKALTRVLPTQSEISNITQLINRGANLSQTEHFLYKLSQIPYLKGFLDLAQFKLSFNETASDLKICFRNWKNLCFKLTNNKRLQKFLQLLLIFGNELNQNHPKLGQAVGFKLSILSSLSGLKSSVDGSSLLEVLIHEFFNLTGNPHIFHRSEHLLLKELSNSSFQSLIDSYDSFFQDFCKFNSIEFPEDCQKYAKDFMRQKNKDIEELFELMNGTKVDIKNLHSYFINEETVDSEGKYEVLVLLAEFYDKYLETVGKKWAGVSNRDSRRFTFINENKGKNK